MVELANTNVDEAKGVSKPILGQQLWRWTLAAGLLTVVLGGIVLAWPGPTILVASTLFGVYLLLAGFVRLFMAFTLPRSAGIRVLLFISGILSVVLAILSFRRFGDAHMRIFCCHCGSESALFSRVFRPSLQRSASRICPGAVGPSSLVSSR